MWAYVEGGMGRALRGDRRGGARGRRRDPARGAGRARRGRGRRARAASCSRTAARSRRRSWCRAPTRARTLLGLDRRASTCPSALGRAVARSTSAAAREDQPRARPAARVPRPRRCGAPDPSTAARSTSARATSTRSSAAFDDARAGRVPRSPAGRAHAAVRTRRDARAARPTRRVAVRAVRALCSAGRTLARAARGDRRARVLALVEEVAPGFTASILHREVLAPPDLERLFGLTGREHLPRRDDARPARAACDRCRAWRAMPRRSAASGSAARARTPAAG